MQMWAKLYANQQPDPELRSPLCLAGHNACPPEDVGGGSGYLEFPDAINDPSHEEHQQMLEWCGGSFDPNAFDLDTVNQRLSEIRL
jgi:Plasmid pRiA4b ORF-3-like protein